MKLNLQFLSRPLTKEVLFTLATFLFLIPKPYHTIPALDASWQVALETAFFKGWEFGRTVNFTGGPLSLLYAPTSLSTHVFSQIAAESAVLILAIFLIFRAMRGQATLMLVLLFGSLLVCSVVANDGIFMVSITAGAFILLRLENSRWAPILIPIYFAVLALMKFSFATLGILCILTLTVGKLLNNDRQTAGKLVGSYVLSFLFIWILIGQNLRTIPGFFINSYYISKGYLWNMHLHDVQTIFFYLVYLLIITSVPIFLFCLAKRREIESWLSLVIAAGTIYLSWKAGITRTGSHMGFFLQAVVVVSFLVKPLASDRKLAAIWVSIITISFISGFIWVYPGGAKPVVSTAWKKFTENLVFIGNPDTLNQSFTRLIPYVLLENELPQIKQKVGDSSIDVLHFQQAILILNGMNYEPRPTVQNYPAYNQHLSNLNLTHIKKSPPEFLIVKYGVIDNRYPYSDDSLYNLEVFQNYKPVLTEKGYLLLERTAEPNEITNAPVTIEGTIESGQRFDISKYSENLLWLQVDYRPSLMHRLYAFFFKPEILTIRVTLRSGTDRTFRLVGGNLKDGFLLNPLLEGDAALEGFLNLKEPQERITSFTIESIPGNTWFSTKIFNLKLSKLTRNPPHP